MPHTEPSVETQRRPGDALAVSVGAVAIVLVCLTGMVTAGAVGAVAANQEGNVTAGYGGDGVTIGFIGDHVERDGNTVYVRRGARPTVDVRYRGHEKTVDEVCLVNEWAQGRERRETCQAPSAVDDDAGGTFFRASEWFSDAPGRHRVIVQFRTADGPTDERRLAVVVLRPGGDRDGDGLNNGEEIGGSTHPAVADTDGDGYTDGLEVEWGSDPMHDLSPRLGMAESGKKAAGPATPPVLSEIVTRLVALLSFDGTAVLSTALAGLAALAVAVGMSLGRRYWRAVQIEGIDLATDEKYLLRLLSANGGQLAQSEIVEQSGWSKAKVNRLLASLEAAGEIKMVAEGRENIVLRPGEESRLADEG